ncbi:chromatin organization modifier domain-containing protein [Hirsutella rhossiliensis]
MHSVATLEDKASSTWKTNFITFVTIDFACKHIIAKHIRPPDKPNLGLVKDLIVQGTQRQFGGDGLRVPGMMGDGPLWNLPRSPSPRRKPSNMGQPGSPTGPRKKAPDQLRGEGSGSRRPSPGRKSPKPGRKSPGLGTNGAHISGTPDRVGDSVAINATHPTWAIGLAILEKNKKSGKCPVATCPYCERQELCLEPRSETEAGIMTRWLTQREMQRGTRPKPRQQACDIFNCHEKDVAACQIQATASINTYRVRDINTRQFIRRTEFNTAKRSPPKNSRKMQNRGLVARPGNRLWRHDEAERQNSTIAMTLCTYLAPSSFRSRGVVQSRPPTFLLNYLFLAFPFLRQAISNALPDTKIKDIASLLGALVASPAACSPYYSMFEEAEYNLSYSVLSAPDIAIWEAILKRFLTNAPHKLYTTRTANQFKERKGQMDLFFHTDREVNSTFTYKDVLVVGEQKKSYDVSRFKADLLQLARYIRGVFADQPTRQFVYALCRLRRSHRLLPEVDADEGSPPLLRHPQFFPDMYTYIAMLWSKTREEKLTDMSYLTLWTSLHDSVRPPAPTGKLATRNFAALANLKISWTKMHKSPQGEATADYQIEQVVGGHKLAYRLRLPSTVKIHNVLPVSSLELYRTRNQEPIEPEDHPFMPESTYDVEKILDHQGPKSRRRYLVKWKRHGDEENSWVSRSVFADKAFLADYDQSEEGATCHAPKVLNHAVVTFPGKSTGLGGLSWFKEESFTWGSTEEVRAGENSVSVQGVGSEMVQLEGEVKLHLDNSYYIPEMPTSEFLPDKVILRKFTGTVPKGGRIGRRDWGASKSACLSPNMAKQQSRPKDIFYRTSLVTLSYRLVASTPWQDRPDTWSVPLPEWSRVHDSQRVPLPEWSRVQDKPIDWPGRLTGSFDKLRVPRYYPVTAALVTPDSSVASYVF